MAFQTKCEHCGTEYKLADKYLRRVLECRKCRESFRAEELAEETPRKRRRSKSDDDDDDDRRPRKRRGKSTSPSNALLWSGIAGGGFLAVVAVVVLVWALASRRNPEPVAAGPNAPADPVIQQANAPPPNQGEFAPVVQGDPVQPPAVKQPRIPAFAPIASASNEVRWTVTADPIAPSPALANFRSLNIDSDAWRTKDLRFSQSDRPGRLAVLRIKTDPTTLWVDHYDLEAGRKLGSIKLANDDRSFETGAIPIPFEASPAGNRVVIRLQTKSPEVQVWDLPTQRKIAQWKPFNAAPIEWAGFVDEDMIATLGDNKLAVWKLPDAKLVFLKDDYRKSAEFTPGRKYLAAWNGRFIDFLDPRTGAVAGQLTAGGEPMTDVWGISFHRDGKRAAAHAATTSPKLFAWDLEKVALISRIEHDQRVAEPMSWAGRYFLKGNTLFDWSSRLPLTAYSNLFQAKAPRSPDERVWFVETNHETKPMASGVLQVRKVPDASTMNLADKIANGNAESLVPPGSAVQLNIVGDEKFRTDATALLESRLRDQGCVVGPGGVTIEIRADAQAGKTNEVIVRRIGPGAGGTEKLVFNDVQVNCSYRVLNRDGAEIFRKEGVFKSTLPKMIWAADFQERINRVAWNQAAQFVNNQPLPTMIFRIDGQVANLPRIASLK